jgi:hypothetical protein
VIFYNFCRSHWPLGLRHRSAAARLLRLCVRIPPGNGCLSVVSVVCCQVEVSWMRGHWPTGGCCTKKKRITVLWLIFRPSSVNRVAFSIVDSVNNIGHVSCTCFHPYISTWSTRYTWGGDVIYLCMHFITDQEFQHIHFIQLHRSLALWCQVQLYEETLFYEIQSYKSWPLLYQTCCILFGSGRLNVSQNQVDSPLPPPSPTPGI